MKKKSITDKNSTMDWSSAWDEGDDDVLDELHDKKSSGAFRYEKTSFVLSRQLTLKTYTHTHTHQRK